MDSQQGDFMDYMLCFIGIMVVIFAFGQFLIYLHERE